MIPDTLRLEPGGTLCGRLRVPGDKSISHRAVMFGALADGVTEVRDCLMGEDVRATIAAFRAMGVAIEELDQGRLLRIQGRGRDGLITPSTVLDCGNSGTSMRLLSGIVAGAGLKAILTGDDSLRRRPMRRVTDPLEQMGARITTQANGNPPIKLAAGAALHAIDYALPVASAQVKSAILLAGLFATGTTKVTEPAPTRDHTERMLTGFGVRVERVGNQISVDGGQRLTAAPIVVPADISSAAFFLVGAALAAATEVVMEAVGINPTRTGVLDILRLMGADIRVRNTREIGGEPVADLHVRASALHGIEVPRTLVPLAIDEFPVLFVAAACAKGLTRVTGAEELRHKESDRIETMATGLRAMGAQVTTLPDGMEIIGGPLGGATIEAHGDHRIAMSFAIASLRATQPLTIHGWATIATSFPTFVDLARAAGMRIHPA
ncbi:MAG: 3-phosphoshikimate 1-carboxyvinyltransferase [Gammaproteobacteria bacterium]|nr:3-phosphoshikimate 1-carboxyvinyltransferase [Gammaproteobacteria bacterium]